MHAVATPACRHPLRCHIPLAGQLLHHPSHSHLAPPFTRQVCSAFIIVAPTAAHARDGRVCDLTSYSRRCWCRVECLTYILGEAANAREEDHGMYIATADGIEPIHVWDYSRATPNHRRPDATSPSDAASPSALCRSSASSIGAGSTRLALTGAPAAGAGAGADAEAGVALPRAPDQKASIRAEWAPLLFAYEGELTCCRLRHVHPSGIEMGCDKERLVRMLVGLYGHVLISARNAEEASAEEAARLAHAHAADAADEGEAGGHEHRLVVNEGLKARTVRDRTRADRRG